MYLIEICYVNYSKVNICCLFFGLLVIVKTNVEGFGNKILIIESWVLIKFCLVCVWDISVLWGFLDLVIIVRVIIVNIFLRSFL